jgi:hypothetical protein
LKKKFCWSLGKPARYATAPFWQGRDKLTHI